jgi:hypothetical protein
MIQACMSLWFVAQGGLPDADAMQHLQAGSEARKQHQVEEEISEFRQATELDPNFAD